VPSRASSSSRVSLLAIVIWGGIICGTPIHAQVTTSISSGSAFGGQSVALNIVASSTGAVLPAALQWTMSYPAADISSVSVGLGPAAAASGKSISCAPSGSGTICIIDGLNQTAIPNGTIAVATVQISPTPVDQNIPLQISGLAAAGGDGSAVADMGTGAMIAIAPAIPQVGLLCSSTTLNTPGSLTCSLSLSTPTQGNAGMAIGLTSNNSLLQVPASVVIPAGASSSTFTATATSATSTESATLTATGGSNAPSVNLTLVPPVQVSPPPTTCTLNCPPAFAVDAGGNAAGNFAADMNFSGGSWYVASNLAVDTSSVTNPAPQAVYQSERFGNFTYTIPQLTPGGTYTVRLHFAEIYWRQTGQRIFNVGINGTAVLSNFDIIATAGAADKAVVEQFTATANPSGQIVVQFTTVKDNAKISGIEVLSGTPQSTGASFAVDAGGNAAGNFAGDMNFSGGSQYVASNLAIDTTGATNPAPQAVYQSERFGNFTYTIPQLTPGVIYTVRLHFAEIYWTRAGQRVFNVGINGAAVLSNFDIFGAVGAADKAVIEQFTATANSSGQIVIQFTTVKDNAKVSGIDVY
jgi:hypothetical protein